VVLRRTGLCQLKQDVKDQGPRGLVKKETLCWEQCSACESEGGSKKYGGKEEKGETQDEKMPSQRKTIRQLEKSRSRLSQWGGHEVISETTTRFVAEGGEEEHKKLK